MKEANIEVYHDGTEVFGILSESDLPTVHDSYELNPYMDMLLEWSQEEYDHLEGGDSVENAGTLKYKSNGEIISIEKK